LLSRRAETEKKTEDRREKKEEGIFAEQRPTGQSRREMVPCLLSVAASFAFGLEGVPLQGNEQRGGYRAGEPAWCGPEGEYGGKQVRVGLGV
jgi:hypothetical protein